MFKYLSVCVFLGVPVLASAQITDLSNVPLVNMSGNVVSPNIHFIFDDSGSMTYSFIPDGLMGVSADSVRPVFCKNAFGRTNYQNSVVNGTTTYCSYGDLATVTPEINAIAYNPKVRYVPPPILDYVNISRGRVRIGESMNQNLTNNYRNVPNNIYLSSSTKNIVTGNPIGSYCKSVWSSECVQADDTSVPTNVYNYYKQSYTSPSYGVLDSYVYCKDSNYRECIVSRFGAYGDYVLNAPYRYCSNYSANDCQKTYSSKYYIVMYPGMNSNSTQLGTLVREFIEPNRTYEKWPDRMDCEGSRCTYVEEMNNFANYTAYYSNRSSAMKTSSMVVFAGLGSNYRVDVSKLTAFNRNDAPSITDFTNAKKSAFFDKLINVPANSSTPLMSALTWAGEIYAGNNPKVDPIQYSCQQNYTILATDGYINESNSLYGNRPRYGDSNGIKPPFASKLNRNNATLADVAYYYYMNDLRPKGSKNKEGRDVSENNVKTATTNMIEGDYATWQHMTTFTMGFGVSGQLDFDESYKTTDAGDYGAIKRGEVEWPKMENNRLTSVDDLWRAAINGHGEYFSAKDPNSFRRGLESALNTITIATGTGSAASTSTLEPVAGDNFIYVGSYRSAWWDGDLAAYEIDLLDGTIATTPSWSSQTQLNNRVSKTSDSDTRKIFVQSDSNVTNGMVDFRSDKLSTRQREWLNPNQLTQYQLSNSTVRNEMTTNRLISYLRGSALYEDKAKVGAFVNYPKIFRARENVLGDIINAQPVFVGAPNQSWSDSGYAEYRNSMSSRKRVLYTPANDGMLHAFDADNGAELWAFIPNGALRKMYKLADLNYSTNHEFFNNATPSISDIYDNVERKWKTILVTSYGVGINGYYALDITNPNSPKFLWEVNENSGAYGLSTGRPIIGKSSDGNWRVYLSSGYNNVVGAGDGSGYVYELNPITGAKVSSKRTGEGSRSTPSGLSKINSWVDDLRYNNTIENIYGGDLFGNMWRFDFKVNTASGAVKLFNVDRPITVTPELGIVGGFKVVFFTTGKMLGLNDISNTDTQYIMAIKDVGNSTVSDIFSKLTKKETSYLGNDIKVGVNSKYVDWVSTHGWYIEMSDEGERGNIDPLLQLGNLMVVTNVPMADACNVSGYSWTYQIDYANGNAIDSAVGNKDTLAERSESSTVGLSVVRLPNGSVLLLRSKADKILPDYSLMKFNPDASGVKKVYWKDIGSEE